jgi:2-amino-4-hydroxy-6-hydroxymethyldihydropteridine diphosphokinase
LALLPNITAAGEIRRRFLFIYMTEIILGLGSNLGDRENNLRKAIALIKAELLKNIKESRIYKSAPVLLDDSPPEWDIEYMNLVIIGKLKDKKMSPAEFLSKIKQFETQLGRKASPRWSPREIDIDILTWGNELIDEPNLKIPHQEMLNREFVMKPLLELLPAWKPTLKQAKLF